MNTSNELALLFKNILDDCIIENYCSSDIKIYNKQMAELLEIFDGKYYIRILESIHAKLKKMLCAILFSHTEDTLNDKLHINLMDIFEYFPKIVDVYPQIITTFINKMFHADLINHLNEIYYKDKKMRNFFGYGDDTGNIWKYNLIGILNDLCAKHKIEKESNDSIKTLNDDEILNFFIIKLKQNIIIFDSSYKFKLFKYKYPSFNTSSIVLYKRDDGLYNLLNEAELSVGDYFINRLTKKHKIKKLLDLCEFLKAFYFNNTDYIHVYNVITNIIYNKN